MIWQILLIVAVFVLLPLAAVGLLFIAAVYAKPRR